MNHGKGLALVTAMLMVLAGLAYGTGATEMSEEESAEPSGIITLYTSIPQPIADKIQADFNERYPSIELEVFRSGTSGVVTKLMTEKEAGAIAADLIWVAEPSTYEDFKEQDLLLEFTPTEASALPPEMKDPEGYYYAGRLINMIIGYNPTLVSEPPATFGDLLDPRFEGKIAMPSPLRSGSAVAAAKTIVDRYGWEYFEEFKNVGGVQAQNNGTVRDGISSGEFLGGIFLDYMARAAEAAGSPLRYVWPEEGAIFIPSPVAILSASGNPEAAKVFVDYVLSVEGQQTLVELGNFIPVRADVQPPSGAPSLDSIEKLPTDWKSVQRELNDINERWTQIFGE